MSAFQQIPYYRKSYDIGAQVFFIPNGQTEPIHGFVNHKTALGDYVIQTSASEVRSTPPFMRPGNTTSVVAWLKIMEGMERTKPNYAVAYMAVSPENTAA